MLAFKDLSVSAGDTHLLTAVTGFVLKGGITAVLGPSSAGKQLYTLKLLNRLNLNSMHLVSQLLLLQLQSA
jgi:ABC-type phosphate transport system ATPase subunit